MKNDIILTLDAGGTNLVFNAIDSHYDIISSKVITAPSESIEEFIEKLITGFGDLNKSTGNIARAISFCFPGPADYAKGIIGDLENLPFFKGGVPLKNILEEKFRIPVFINNDGDLFTLGEAISGIIPEINKELAEKGNSRIYKNLLGITLGPGTGGGIVIDGKLLIGDNSAGAEINRSNNFMDSSMSIEETLSIRGVKTLYSNNSGISMDECPEPGDIFKIAGGTVNGNKNAAIETWKLFGTVLGHSLANAVTLVDGLIVIGGGLSGAYTMFMPTVIEAMNGKFTRIDGHKFQRLEVYAYNLEDPEGYNNFMKNEDVELSIFGSTKTITYSPVKKIGIGVSKLGTSKAVAIGAFAYASTQ